MFSFDVFSIFFMFFYDNLSAAITSTQAMLYSFILLLGNAAYIYIYKLEHKL